MNISSKVYELCKKIPHGRISTYREIAHKLNSKAYRAVGQVLKKNKNPDKVPCFKIIKTNGKIGGYCGSNPNNVKKKIKLLRKEGIIIKDGKIDISKYLYKFDK